MHAAIAIPHARLADLLDPPLDGSLVRPPGLVVVAGCVKTDGSTGLPYRHAPIDAHPGHDLSKTPRLQIFRRITSCNISRSNVRSATVFFRRVFSSSSAFNRRISSGSRPPYFFFQLKQVACLIPALRQITATGMPCSPCFRMKAFCASVNFDALMRLRSSPNQERIAENSSFKLVQFSGGRAAKRRTNGGTISGRADHSDDEGTGSGRMHSEKKLKARHQSRRKRALGTSKPMILPSRAHQRRSLECVSGALAGDLRFSGYR